MHPPYPSYVLDRIRSIAADSPCEEVGGVVIATPGAFRTVKIKNCSYQPDENYIPHGIGIIEASELGHLELFWHTHINGKSNFSATDINSIWENDFPWLLYDLKNNTFNYFDPALETSLLNRSWELGLTDCYSLVRDFYRWHLEIILPVPEHDGREKPWLDPQWNRAIERLPQHFNKLDLSQARPYDVVAFKSPYRNCNPAHVGILLPTEAGLQILHHPCHQLSKLEPIVNPELIHSIWRTKHTISESNYSVHWGVDLGKSTNLQPPNLVKVSVTSGTNTPNLSQP